MLWILIMALALAVEVAVIVVLGRHTTRRYEGERPVHVRDEGAGRLTEAVARRRCSVVVVDDLGKAHPDVVTTMLHALDEGRLTDARGGTVDVRDTVVIMASALGAVPRTGR